MVQGPLVVQSVLPNIPTGTAGEGLGPIAMSLGHGPMVWVDISDGADRASAAGA